MKENSLLAKIRPRFFTRWRLLPLFGPLLDDFLPWLRTQGYAMGTLSNFLDQIPKVVVWLQRRGIATLAELTRSDLQIAQDHYRQRHEKVRWVIRALERFLSDRHLVPEGDIPTARPLEREVANFSVHLRETRGLAEATIQRHASQLRSFLRFLRFERDPSRLPRIQLVQIEGFLRQAARTNNRFSLQQIVATLRAFLRRQHEQGLLSRPLHLQIDTPRVYRGERLPRALPWEQVRTFIQSIDRSEPFGRRDFTLLYLAAAYGLRSGELVRLTLDDIDWRGRTVRVLQTKTRQALQLPLTDEAANVLIDYLRKARPQSVHRQLFLRMRAPIIPLQPASVHDVLEHRLRSSGLNLPPFGTHVLRHSFATRLMRQGLNLKTIGDTLGHRDVESTSVYLRLNVDDLREVGLPVPLLPPGPPSPLIDANRMVRLRPARPRHHLSAHFQSRFATSLKRFVELKRTLGCKFKAEATILGHWDNFLHRRYPRAGKVRAQMFHEWTKTLIWMTTTGRRNFQRIVRNFLLFHARDHAGTFIPDRLIFPKPAPVVTPRLVSEAEMGRVLAIARQLPPSAASPIRAEMFSLGFILLFCCGLRRGELFRLTLGDIQAEQTVLHIRLTKFHKSRWVPLSPSVTAEVRQYLQKRRQKKLPMAPESFLMWHGHSASEHYSAEGLGQLWHRLCVSAGVLNAQGRPPRVHDLRHSAAVNVLQRWYAQGGDVQAQLPYLAAYLGHVSVVSTHHYLKLTPELRRAASQRFHQRFAPVVSAGGAA